MDSYNKKSRECNWMFNIGEILKVGIVMDLITQTINRGNRM